MASKTTSFVALFLAVNLLFFTHASAYGTCGGGVTPKPPKHKHRCPADTLKLGVCADVLNGLINLNIDSVPKTPCCSLLSGLTDVEAVVCLCTALKANVLGIISLDVKADLSLLLNYCGNKTPKGFQCA